MKKQERKKFTVTFETVNKNPKTRTLEVLACDETHARNLVTGEYDSYKFKTEALAYMPTGKHIRITKVSKA